jgi:CHAT domain-containing protein
MKIKLYFLFFFCIFFQFSFCQDAALKKLIDNYTIEKNDSIKLIKVQKAFSYLEKSKTKTESQYIEVLEQLYLSQYDNYLDADAEKNAEKLFLFVKKKNNTKYNVLLSKTAYFIHTTNDYLQNYTKAIAYNQEQYKLEKAINGEKSEQVAKAHLQASVYYSRIDNVDQQIKSLNAAKAILENITVKNKQLLFDMYQYYVITLIYYGDIPKSKSYLDKLNQVFEKNKLDKSFITFTDDPESNLSLNICSTVLCNIMYHKLEIGNQNELIKSVNLFENHLQSKPKKFTIKDLSTINDFYCQMGIYYTEINKNINQAQKMYDKALNYNLKYPSGLVYMNYHKAWTYFKFSDWKNAEAYFKKCINSNEVSQFIELISLYKNYGITLFHLNKLKESQVYLKKVEDFYNNQNTTYQGFMSLTNLKDVGNLYISIYKKNKDKKLLKRSFTCFKNASKLFSKIYQGDSFNQNLSNRVNDINKGLLFCSTELNDKKGEVLELVEKNKSDFLWASFLNNNQNKAFIEPKKIIDSLNAFENRKQDLSLKLKSLKDKKESKEVQNQIVEQETKLKRNKDLLQNKFPSFNSFATNSVSLKDIQSKLKTNEVILNYVVLDTMTYVFEVTNNKIDLHLISKDNQTLKNKCVSFYNKLKSIDNQFTAEGKELYSILIKPLELPKNGKLIILTNSFLSYLPFEVLQNNNQFLVSNYAISYSNSVKLWNTQTLLPKNRNSSLAAFSPEYDKLKIDAKDTDLAMLTRAGNYELFGAKKEAEIITNLFEGTFFNSEEATKKSFVENASKYQILHLAMHSIMNEANENQSNLIFSNNEKLYFPEIYNLQLPSDLAVLSACNTGVGGYKNGEGIMSVSRAFTYAGIKSTVVSLWQVPDKETSEIMISFYENLKKGQSKDEALANAKTSFIKKNPMKNHPFYWAGFVVNGDVSPIITSSNWMLYLGIGLAVLLLIFLFRKKLFQFQK